MYQWIPGKKPASWSRFSRPSGLRSGVVPSVPPGPGASRVQGIRGNGGVRFPWIQRRLDVARMLVEEFEQLTDAERKQLVGTFPDLFVETPRTAAAELTFKRLILKAGKEAADAMRRILLDILSEAVRKSLFGP